MNYLQGFGTDFYYYTEVATGNQVIFPDTYDPELYNPGAYTKGNFAYSDTAPPPDTNASNWASTLPIIGNFLVQTGIIHPSIPPNYKTNPNQKGYQQPTSNMMTYMILGGLGIGALLLVKMLMEKGD